MQASAEHLLSAAIMSAPAALAMAKLSYPETEESHTKTQEDVYIENVYACSTCHLNNKKHLKNVRPIRHCEPPHAACSNCTLPFTGCRYCRHHYQDEPKPAIAIAQAACDSSDTW